MKLKTYTIKFKFNCVSKRGMVSGMLGEASIDSDATPTELYSDLNLLSLLGQDMAKKTKKQILSLDITDIAQVP